MDIQALIGYATDMAYALHTPFTLFWWPQNALGSTEKALFLRELQDGEHHLTCGREWLALPFGDEALNVLLCNFQEEILFLEAQNWQAAMAVGQAYSQLFWQGRRVGQFVLPFTTFPHFEGYKSITQYPLQQCTGPLYTLGLFGPH